MRFLLANYSAVKIALRGMRQARGIPKVRKAYKALVRRIFLFSLIFTTTGVSLLAYFAFNLWGELNDAVEVKMEVHQVLDVDANIVIVLLLIVAILIMLILGPIISMFCINLIFPSLNHRVFMAAMEHYDPERARALGTRTSLSIRKSLAITARRFRYFLIMSAMLLIVGSIAPPPLAPFVAIAEFIISARIVGMELLDPYFDMSRRDGPQQKDFFQAHRSEIYGLGIPCALLLCIPVLGGFFFGLSQSSAALWVDQFIPLESDQPQDA